MLQNSFSSFRALVWVVFLIVASVAGTPAFSQLSAPTELRAHPLSDTIIRLDWIPAETGAGVLTLFRRMGSAGAWEALDENFTATPPWEDTALQSGEVYDYRITATDETGTAFSGTARAHTDTAPFGERTVSFQNGIQAYEGAQDVGLRQLTPTQSLTGRYLWIDRNSASDDNQALLRFDDLFGPSPNQIPLDARPTRAILRIYLGAATSVESPEVTLFHRMLVPWDGTASWNSSFWSGSGQGVNYQDVDARAAPEGSMTFDTVGRFYDVEVTPSLQAWADGAPVEGWLIRTNSANGYGYYTTQAPLVERPELIVTWDTDPGNRRPTVVDRSPTTPAPRETATTALGVDDLDGDPLTVTLYGRAWPTVPPDFTVIVLPDSQYYPARLRGGLPGMFNRQTDWIVAERERLNIPFVLHVGDVVHNGDRFASGSANNLEWAFATQAMRRLENPLTTGLRDGIPYTISVGNHDQQPNNDPNGRADFFNQYFGIEHFSTKAYYGGSFSTENNNSHYELFEAGAYKFLSISLEFNAPTRGRDAAALLAWADALLKRYPDRRGFITTHFVMRSGNPGPWSEDGAAIYEALKGNPNLHLMFGGHVRGEGWRTDRHDGNTVHTFLQNYQFYPNGGSGFLRLFTFSPRHNEIRVQTYSPWLETYETDWNSEFTVPYPMGQPDAPEFRSLATAVVAPGETFTYTWNDLTLGTEYEWFAVVDDGRKTTETAPVTFSTAHPYEDWRERHFGIALERGEPTADPDRNGYPNRLEYYLGRHPGGLDNPPLPTLEQEGDTTVLRYQRRTAHRLYLHHTLSDNLDRWFPFQEAPWDYTETITEVNEEMETVEHRFATPPGTTLFFRLEAY